MRIVKSIGLLLAAFLCVGQAHAQRLTTFQATPQSLANIPKASSHNLVQVPVSLRLGGSHSSSVQHHIFAMGANAGFQHIGVNSTSSAAVTGAAHRIQGQGKHLQSLIQQSVGNLSFPSLPHSLHPTGQGFRLTATGNATLARMTGLYQDIANGTLSHRGPEEISTQSLRDGIDLGNGWVLKFFGQYRYALVQRESGLGLSVWGDPHISRAVNNSPDGEAATHYGDWTADRVVFMLPAANPADSLIVLARSTGGDAANGFGLPTDLVAIGNRHVTCVQGLNTTAATGFRSFDPYFTHQALKGTLEGAAILYWDAKTSEVRNGAGERTAPPASARDYTRSRSELVYDTHLNGLLRNGPRVLVQATDADKGISEADLSVREKARQALSASKNPRSEIAAAGNSYLGLAKPYAREMIDFGAKRLQLVEELEGILGQIEKLNDALSSPRTSLTDLDRIEKELTALTEKARQRMKALENLDRRGKN